MRGNSFRILLLLCIGLVSAGCNKNCTTFPNSHTGKEGCNVLIHLTNGGFVGKASSPDENVISNVNLFVYDGYGLLEIDRYLTFSSGVQDAVEIPVELIRAQEFSIYAIANAGFDIDAVSIDELLNAEYFMAYPDEFSKGIVMTGKMEHMYIDGISSIEIPLKRLMSKVSVRFDRSCLDDGIDLNVYKIMVGNCPCRVNIFGDSSISVENDKFLKGFCIDGGQVLSLNKKNSNGLSDEVPLYLFENIQNKQDKDLCSYVEIYMDYISDRYYTDGDEGLVYRLFLREPENGSNACFDVRRNCHYHVRVCPQGDGLQCDDSWKVDKSRLHSRGTEPFLAISPSGSYVDGKYYENYFCSDINGKLTFTLSFFPADLKISLREDLVEDEKNDGRALWEISSDCREVTMTALGRKCLSMMEIEAGWPLNDSETLVVEIN